MDAILLITIHFSFFIIHLLCVCFAFVFGNYISKNLRNEIIGIP